MKKLYILILALLLTVLIIGCTDKKQEIISNNKDEYGCLISEGYKYCIDFERCILPNEEYCPSWEQKNTNPDEERAINLSTPYIIDKPMYKDNNGRLLRLEKIDAMRCIGCFSLYYNFLIDNKNNEIEKINVRVDINNWKPVLADFKKLNTVFMTEEECIYYNYGFISKECINQTSIARVNDNWCCI